MAGGSLQRRSLNLREQLNTEQLLASVELGQAGEGRQQGWPCEQGGGPAGQRSAGQPRTDSVYLHCETLPTTGIM